jgi:hypothetical protein
MQKYLMYSVLGIVLLGGGLFLLHDLAPRPQQGLPVSTSAPAQRKPAYASLPPQTPRTARQSNAAGPTEVGQQGADSPAIFAKTSVQPSLSSQPRLDQQERSETSATQDVAESGLATEAIQTALLESLEAADRPFAEQAALLASLLPDGASGEAPGIDKEESLDATSEALSAAEFETALAASLTAAGVPAAEMPALLASLLPDSDATAPAETTGEESLDATSEALSAAEFEAALAASLTAAGVPAADIASLLEHLLPQSDRQP